MKMPINHKLPFSLVSKYRSELMGIAIIEVMLGHFCSWINISPFESLGKLGILVSRLFDMVHTPGFMLLSGLGLYYSFYKNADVISFYIRRIKRMWLPYILMALPCVGLIAYIRGGLNVDVFIGWVTSLGYWFPGDTQYCNMWYISMSVVCYLFFPFIYNAIFTSRLKKKVGPFRIFLCIAILCVVLTWAIAKCFPAYFDLVYLAVPKSVMFIIGIYWGYLSINNKEINAGLYTICLAMIFLFFFIWSRVDITMFNFAEFCVFLFTIPLVCVVLERFQHYSFMRGLCSVWSWVGKYTLELYVLHIMLARILSELEISNELTPYIAISGAFILCVPVHLLTCAAEWRK